MLTLAAASLITPPGLERLIAEIGAGENGFSGTSVNSGETSLQEFLQCCVEMTDHSCVKPGFVPQTVYWALNEAGEAIGMLRLRHYLNDQLRQHGGHCGYYVRRDQRGKGYGKQMLKLALLELQRLGETKALMTTTPDNVASIHVIEANGGVFADEITLPKKGVQCRRYWIDLPLVLKQTQ